MMVSAERYTADYSYLAPSNYAENYARSISQRSTYPAEKDVIRKKIQYAPDIREVEKPTATTVMSQASLLRTILLMVIAGALIIGIVWMGAKATEIQYSINQIKNSNSLVEDEIAMLEIKIESANSIESVEDYATSHLRMRYPRNNQCIYLNDNTDVKMNLVEEIKLRAYK